MSPQAAWADILFYLLSEGHVYQFEGEAKVDSGRTVTFRHPEFGIFYFSYDRVKFFKAPSTFSLAQAKLRKAKENPEDCLDAARWCLHHGQLNKFYEAASAAWRADRNHPTVKRLVRLKQKMEAPLPLDKKQEGEILKYIKVAKDLEFAHSKHFLLAHNMKGRDSCTMKRRGKRLSPAEERLELLEKVYESFLIKFYLEGSELEIPKERLMVCVFAEKNDFSAFCDAAIGKGTKPAGLYDKRSNIAVFYDQGTHEAFKGFDEAKKQLAELVRQAKNMRSPAAGELVRYTKSLDLLIEVYKLNQDIEVVTHECTHQMAANTRLMPNKTGTPVWVAEGIATYFESPREAAWAGIGTVNESRLSLYRALANDTEHCNLEFIVSDNIFMQAGSHGSLLHAYGQAWALTHFLMAEHFDQLMELYRHLAARVSKTEKPFSPKKNLELFKKVFGDDLDTLNAQWHRYMRSLKTDVERIVAGE